MLLAGAGLLLAGQAGATSLEPHASAHIVRPGLARAILHGEDPAVRPAAPLANGGASSPVASDSIAGASEVDLDDVFGAPASRDVVAQGATDALATESLGASIGVGPLVDPGSRRESAMSVSEMVRSVATITGERTPSGSAASGPRPAGGVPMGALRELVLELLQESVSIEGTVNGRTVFSILGKGLFTLQIARDRSVVSLTELASGRSVIFGGDSDAGTRSPETPPPPGAEARASDLEMEVFSSRGAADFVKEGPLTSLMSAVTGMFSFVGRALAGLASSPLMLVLVLPVVLVLVLLDVLQHKQAPGADAPEPEADAPLAPAAPAEPRRRRRSRRGRRVRWRAYLAEIRNSLGFPVAELIRESDVFPERGRRRRRRRRFV